MDIFIHNVNEWKFLFGRKEVGAVQNRAEPSNVGS